MNKDSVYATPKDKIDDFQFDETVASVFEDMLRRSIPGYNLTLDLVGLFAADYVQANSYCFDLGSSLGAVSVAIQQNIHQKGCRIFAVDNSQAMIRRSISRLNRKNSAVPIHLICADIQHIKIVNASLVALNFTLQFIQPEKRITILQRIYEGLLPGGILLLSEKMAFDENEEQMFQTKMYYDFKKLHGYSELEISQKRSALENILIPDTLSTHCQRLRKAGFERCYPWFQAFNFRSVVAIK